MAVAQCLCQVNLYSAELASAKAERDELRTRVLGLDEEKRKVEEHYDLMDGKKVYVEEHVASLDGSVEHLEKRVETQVG